MTTPDYIEGANLPDYTVDWYLNGSLLDLTGHTFVVEVGQPGAAASFTKSTGITGAATSPSVTIAWATSGEIKDLAAGDYTLEITATRSADSKVRKRQFRLQIGPEVG